MLMHKQTCFDLERPKSNRYFYGEERTIRSKRNGDIFIEKQTSSYNHEPDKLSLVILPINCPNDEYILI